MSTAFFGVCNRQSSRVVLQLSPSTNRSRYTAGHLCFWGGLSSVWHSMVESVGEQAVNRRDKDCSLDNETCGDGPNDEIDPLRDKRRLRFIGYVKRKLENRRAKKEKESATDRAARKTASASVWMAVFTLVLATASVGGIWISYRTLTEIQSGAAQTAQTIITLRSQASSLEGQLNQLKESNRTAKDTLVANSRAWVGIQGTSSAAPVADSELDINIAYANTGHQPATNLSYLASAFILTAKEAAEGAARVNMIQEGCLSADRRNLGVAYPTTGFSAYTLRARIPKGQITKQVIDQGDNFLVSGCLSYETFGERRHSFFCMYYSSKLGRPENWNFCEVGNSAN
jgi:hypothetical protein